MSDAERWLAYFDAQRDAPARSTLLLAADRAAAEGLPKSGSLAVDLGCGTGPDTLELLRRGWRVLAIDGHEEGIARLRARVPQEWADRLETRVCSFEAMPVLPRADLINASFSVFFCPPAHFPSLWENIGAALVPGGRFSGQLLGERDTWAARPEVTTHSAGAVDDLVAGFVVDRLQEDEADGPTAVGTQKHWHLFHVVIQKPEVSG